MIPVSDLDQYGNAVVTRHTRRVDPETGWPYEIWLKEPRLELVLVPAGELTMGCSFTPEEMIQRYEGEAKDYEPERPAHPVRITRSFYLGKYEVTRSQWSHVMGSQPWVGGKYVRENPLHPAVCINWFDWREFMKKLGAIATDEAQLKAGKDLAAVFRYPTEAEWEYACRAGSTAAFCFGDDVEKLKDYAWCKRNAWDVGRGYTHPVGRRKPNALGLYGLHGNVAEWCWDWFAEYPPDPQTDPRGPAHGRERVIRGGTFWWAPRSCRSSARQRRAPRGVWYGFSVGTRVALSLERAGIVPKRMRDPSGPPPPEMPKDATRFRGHWYKFIAGDVSWHAAKKRCEEMGGYLVCVESREENDFLRTFAKGQSIWLGATDEAQEGVWRWVNGSKFTYADWFRTEPNNYRKNEHYLEVSPNFGSKWEWFDATAEGHKIDGFICEWEPRRAAKRPDAVRP